MGCSRASVVENSLAHHAFPAPLVTWVAAPAGANAFALRIEKGAPRSRLVPMLGPIYGCIGGIRARLACPVRSVTRRLAPHVGPLCGSKWRLHAAAFVALAHLAGFAPRKPSPNARACPWLADFIRAPSRWSCPIGACSCSPCVPVQVWPASPIRRIGHPGGLLGVLRPLGAMARQSCPDGGWAEPC